MLRSTNAQITSTKRHLRRRGRPDLLNTAAISTEALANVIDQSVDCVKLLNLQGEVLWMNSNGICAMEIDDTSGVYGKPWLGLWPEESRGLINDALITAQHGKTVRFDAFCPTAKGSPRWWSVTVSGVNAPDGNETGFLAISRDISETEVQRRSLAIAADELRHRLKNTYAMVCGLINSLAMGNPENEVFAREMNSRLVALSAAQSFFMAPDVPRDIAQLLPALVQPFVRSGCIFNTDDVAHALISRREADVLALVVGELAVNSSKHGALRHGGSVTLAASVGAGTIALIWTELSVEPVTAHTRPDGQGLNLIAMMVDAHGGTITTDWGTHGPVVRLTLPAAA